MPKKTWIAIALLIVWLGACYALRFGLMENQHWVNVCDGSAALWTCEARKTLGLIIHLRLLAATALILAITAFVVKSPRGVQLGWLAIVAGLPALVLYAATPASFALLIAGLRLTRSAPLA